jgi:hypothetical protein
MYPTGVGERLAEWVSEQPRGWTPRQAFGVDALTWRSFELELYAPSAAVIEAIAAAGGPPALAWIPLRDALERACRVCGCTEMSCRQCIERTGVPCHWVEADLCSACQE